jgi:hypothetical protein
MLNRRFFIKGLIGGSIAFCYGSVFAGIRDIKDIAENSIIIEGKKYVAAPIYTPEDARAAFSSASTELPSVKSAINKIVEQISKLNAVDEHRMWVEVGYLSDAIDSLYAEWEKRHGIISIYKNNHSKLLAWTRDGEFMGPPYDFGDSAKEEKVSARDNNGQNVSNGASGEYIVIIDGVRYCGAPTYPSSEVQTVFSSVLAELPYLQKKIEKIRDTIYRLDDFGGLRMSSEIQLLECKISYLVNEFEKRHGIAQIFSTDDDRFHIAVWTEKGIVEGPVFSLQRQWYQL